MKPKSGITRFHNCYILRDSKIIKEDLWIRDGKIENPEQVFYVEQLQADLTVNCEGLLIAPGFIDIQINGGWGVDFSYDSENVKEGVRKVAKELLAHGVTSFCPTMVTSDVEKYRKILPLINKTQGGKHGATVLGVHLEGPFINLAKKGAHMEEYIRTPDKGLKTVEEVYGSLDDVVIVTLAPELPGATAAIKELTDLGIKVALGHSTASLAQAEKGVECGANLITHLFNAMLPFHHRDPGLVGLLASTTEKQVFYGIISDGIHTHPAALRIASRTNPEGLVLVSDAVAAQGLADGNYRIGPQLVTVEDGRAYVTGTKVLCGSTAALDSCVATLKQSLDCSMEYALEAASLHPAKALGIDNRKGKLDFGFDADFVILNPENIKITSTWIAGECVFECDKK
ncbi:N-acetylglucosamine-6-phosphate deacetylase [Trichoplusia ni]|uniref:N-acetylglucosamine-6-phosphate deacetylase n=1 Tax=Trichoplusia ni TaxID=7111 RepID=A0A7E5X217_TRINI|nr:N-acetylglucosamine-6-phosphate deacetylase [Trichoplusia ni]XP_026747225.1 N-acetylglucosamine-6-phosphate deacetylase [Trichoplusia ni]